MAQAITYIAVAGLILVGLVGCLAPLWMTDDGISTVDAEALREGPARSPRKGGGSDRSVVRRTAD